MKTNYSLVVLAAACFFLCGCQTNANRQVRSEHLVAIDPEGRLLNPSDNTPYVQAGSDVICPIQCGDYFTKITEAIEAKGLTNILIFIQGGLNTVGSGVERANSSTTAILTDSVKPYYPIFVAWNSNLYHSYLDHLIKIRQGKEVWWAMPTAPFVLFFDAARLVARSPLSLVTQFTSDMKSASLLESLYNTNNTRVWNWEVRKVNQGYMDARALRPDLDVTMGSSHQNFGQFCARAGTYWLTLPAKVVTTPAVDTAGRNAWNIMRRRTQTMFVTPKEFDEAAMTLFLDHLETFCRRSNKPFQITLVGHSMGAIVCNSILRRCINRPDIPIKNIVYMAAACGVDEFSISVVPYLQRHQKTEFYNLCLHPENDAQEWHVNTPLALGELGPRGSLLEWIDNYYSSTETEFGRTLGKWDNIILPLTGDSIPLDPELHHRMHVKAFGLGWDPATDPQHHGDLDDKDNKFWRQSYWEP